MAEDGAAAPSLCRQRLTPEIAIIHPLPPVTGPGACGVADPVRLEAIWTPAGKRINVSPHAVLGCDMAAAVAHWVRDEADPLVEELAGPIATLAVDAAFECRGRNRIAGAKVSQHGFGNALDVHGFTLTGGKLIVLTDTAVSKELRERLQVSACARFTTVLGPGSDGYHENHVHLDVLQRRGGYRICQWEVR